MITNSNQVYFAKVLGREVQEEVLALKETSPPKPDFEEYTYKSSESTRGKIDDYYLKARITKRTSVLIMSINPMSSFRKKGDRMSQIIYPGKENQRLAKEEKIKMSPSYTEGDTTKRGHGGGKRRSTSACEIR